MIHHFPLFIDEGIHIHMARALSGQPGQGLFDGKWLTIQIFALATRLPLDPLLATRSVAMLFGLATAFACFLIGRELFSLREGVISASTYVILPFTLIYNSLALTDSFQTAFGAYVVLSSILVVRAGKLRHVAFLFGALITAILAKLTGVFFLSIPLVAALIPVPGRLRYQALLRIAPAVLGVLALLVGLWLEGLLFVEGVTGKIQGGSEVFGRLLANTGGAASWLYDLLTPPIAVLTLLALILPLVFERNRADLFLSAVLLLEIVPYVIVAHVWFPRYLLFVTVPVCSSSGGSFPPYGNA
ncbi:MAG TPA: glycosyltransferase family 39 protein [Methylomirabilota bacterium]|nr:glycosyltransferase family 39 protein [Methylomirabilota bacterium]